RDGSPRCRDTHEGSALRAARGAQPGYAVALLGQHLYFDMDVRKRGAQVRDELADDLRTTTRLAMSDVIGRQRVWDGREVAPIDQLLIAVSDNRGEILRGRRRAAREGD